VEDDVYVVTYEYDANGNRTAQVEPLNRRTTYSYEVANRLTQVTYPDATTVRYTYNYRGQRLTETDPLNRTTTSSYDKAGRLTKVTHPDGAFSTTSYDELGRVQTQTDERGHTTTYEYDPGCACSGRVAKVTDALGRFTQSQFDAAGRLSSSLDQKGRETKYVYDVRGRLTKTVFPDNTAVSSVYDALNRVTNRTDQAGQRVQYGYDALGNLTAVTNALNQTTRYGYDTRRQLVSITEADGGVTSYQLGALGRRLVRFRAFGSGFDQYTYDAALNLKTQRGPNGKLTTYHYDGMNRLTSVVPDASLNEPTISYTYNAKGQRLTMTDASGTTAYSYDNRDRLSSKQTPVGTLSYTYDAAGNVLTTQSSNANGLSVSYAYDALNRLQSVTDQRLSPGVTSYSYDEAGNLAQTTQLNGVQHTYSYSAANDLLTQLNLTQGTTTLARYSYTYTPARLRASMTELSGRSTSYGYDAADQLTSETIANAPQPQQNGFVEYFLDAVGNRTQRNSTLAALPTLTTERGWFPGDSFDANGNQITADGVTLSYDFRDKLKSTSGGVTAIGYDGDGQRTSKTINGVTTHYLVDELNPTGYAQVVEELVNGQVQRVYTYGQALLSQRQLIAGSWVTSHYGYDGSGNVRVLTNGAGAVTDTFDYDAYGNLLGRTGTTPNSYLYRGQQFDADLGVYYLRARYYSPQRGRFLTRDTFDGNPAEPRSLHKYLYAQADPINQLDASGFASTTLDLHQPVEFIIGVDGFAVDTVGGLCIWLDGFAQAPVKVGLGLGVLAQLIGHAPRQIARAAAAFVRHVDFVVVGLLGFEQA
jgi:RHS repeat-associated protein